MSSNRKSSGTQRVQPLRIDEKNTGQKTKKNMWGKEGFWIELNLNKSELIFSSQITG